MQGPDRVYKVSSHYKNNEDFGIINISLIKLLSEVCVLILLEKNDI